MKTEKVIWYGKFGNCCLIQESYRYIQKKSFIRYSVVWQMLLVKYNEILEYLTMTMTLLGSGHHFFDRDTPALKCVWSYRNSSVSFR